MPTPLARIVPLAVFLAGASASASAHGQASAADSAAAEALFREGKQLAASGRTAEACAKFAESQRLDPGTGTLLELAQCDEQAGKMASAWAEYTDAVSASQRAGRTDRVQFGRNALARVEPQMAHLTIRLRPAATAIAGLEVRRDGALIGSGALGTAIPVDPGTHVVVVSAPARVTWTQTVTLANGATAATVDVPVLATQEASAPAWGGAPIDLTARTEMAPAPVEPATGTVAVSGRSSGIWRTAGWMTGAAGIVSLGIGAAFGISAAGDKNSAECNPNNECEPASLRSAKSAAVAADVGFIAGGVLLAGGALLLFQSRARGMQARVAPMIGTSGGGMLLGGSW